MTPSSESSKDSKNNQKRRAKLRQENRILDAYGVQTGARNLMMFKKVQSKRKQVIYMSTSSRVWSLISSHGDGFARIKRQSSFAGQSESSFF
jgi:hypothetical protein